MVWVPSKFYGVKYLVVIQASNINQSVVAKDYTNCAHLGSRSDLDDRDTIILIFSIFYSSQWIKSNTFCM